jgi:hypothetical protein
VWEEADYIEECRAELLRTRLCFSCHFWRRHIEDPGEAPHRVVVDGHHYIIGEEGPAVFKGFGGAKWRIRFADGRETCTSNLWHQGEIPTHFRGDLPDNAVFVPVIPTKDKDDIPF